MLNVFRQRQSLVKVVLGAILFLVVVSMAVTLIPGITGDTGDTATNPIVADVGGDKITTYELQQSVQQVSQRTRIPTEMMPFYTSQILNQMIVEKASLKEAGRLGLKVSESELQAQLKQDPNLFPNGGFVGQEKYEDLVSERYGMNVPQFEERFRQAMLLDKLRQLVTDSVTVPDQEIHDAYVRDNEKVVLDYVYLVPADFRKEIHPADSVLEDYYHKSKDRYQVPEKRSVKILLVSRDKVRQATAVSDAEIQKDYQNRLEAFRIQERVMVRHILIKADAKDPAQLEAAKKKAEDLLKKLKAGQDFSALAKQNSDDPATAVNGGVLNWINRKQTVPEFEKAAFSLAPGVVSDPVQTVYGIHIIQGIAHEQPHLQTLEEAKSQIQSSILDAKVAKILADEGDQAAAALARSPGDIAALAEKYHGEVLTPPPFAQDETLPRIGPSPQFLQEIFGLEKGKAGPAIAVSDGYAVPVLLDVLPAHPGEWAEVKDRVKNDYLDEQSKEKALSKAQDLVKAVEQQDKKDLKKAARILGLTVKTSSPVARDGTVPSVGSVKDLDPKIFQMPVGGTSGPTSIGGGQAVYQVQSHETPKEEEFEGKKELTKEKLLAERRQLAFEVFQDNLVAKLTASGRLKKNNDALKQLTAPGSSTP